MIEGSCLCGGVRYRYEGEFSTITVCHCSDCRKAQGSTSVVAAPIDAARLQWLQGQGLITEYASSPGKMRAFCSRCGTPLYSRRDGSPDVLRLRMGTIDTPTDARPAAHIFATKLPAWAAMDDDCPRYEGLEPQARR
ncbi:GFA family protein [Noviherbaspirillum sp.]|uniref:GFA family protein n=1 Tax=Noviherbaspirillum sp. TaxID=1926288 RepID=UPI002B4A0634|nr:GFA family protein [Noviherbaspirillum sp.]HJV83257.1 GFA family protein [Noviherbaspirillum sp.]